jgi:deoxycytidylate deaminase
MSVLSKWDERYLALAKEVSTWSKDPSTQVVFNADLNNAFGTF